MGGRRRLVAGDGGWGADWVLWDGTVLVGLGVTARPENAVASVTRSAHQDQSRQKHQAAGCARLSLYEEAEKVEDHEHDMIVQEGWVDRLWDEQDWDQPLEAVHQAAVVAAPRLHPPTAVTRSLQSYVHHQSAYVHNLTLWTLRLASPSKSWNVSADSAKDRDSGQKIRFRIQL